MRTKRKRASRPYQPTITIDVQRDGRPRLWVDCELIETFTKRTFALGKPLQMAKAIEKAFISIHIFPKWDIPTYEELGLRDDDR